MIKEMIIARGRAILKGQEAPAISSTHEDTTPALLEFRNDILPAENAKDLFRLEPADFVVCCYQTFLGRVPDEAGYQAYRAALNEHNRVELALDIANSAEGRAKQRQLPGFDDIVINEYDERVSACGEAAVGPFLRIAVKYLGALARSQLSDRGRIFLSRHMTIDVGLVSVLSSATYAPTAHPAEPLLWIDLTSLLTNGGAALGFTRYQVELARHIKRLRPHARFVVQVLDGFAEIDGRQLNWLLETDSLEAFLLAAQKAEREGVALVTVDAPRDQVAFNPFRDEDAILFFAKEGSRRETLLGEIRKQLPHFKVCCALFEVDEAKGRQAALGSDQKVERSRRYLRWLSQNSDVLIMGSHRVAADLSEIVSASKLLIPPIRIVQLGTDLPAAPTVEEWSEFLSSAGITGSFALHVGELRRSKNLDTIYRAWLLALEVGGEVPQLVLCGRMGPNMDELLDAMLGDPRLKGKIVRLQATDSQLAGLYHDSLFVIASELNSSSSMALPEALARHKRCLVADTEGLRTVGGDRVVYVDPYDVRSWSKRILELATCARTAVETLEAPDLNARNWADTAAEILVSVDSIEQSTTSGALARPFRAAAQPKPTIWMDLTTTFLEWSGHVTGITRAELTFAYYLKKVEPETRFFAHVRGPKPYFFEIEKGYLQWLFDAKDLTKAYNDFHAFWKHRETEGGAFRNPFTAVGGPVPSHPAYIPAFPPNSVVFFAAIDQDGTGDVHRVKDVLPLVRLGDSSMTSQLIYDLTPILIPHVHADWTCRGYAPFVEFVSQHFDHLLYGGRTAQRDAIKIQRANGWRSPPSDFVEFGSDLALAGKQSVEPRKRARSITKEKRILETLGITGNFVMTVGSIEPRKNHEMLYKAYLHLLEQKLVDEPLQMVFVGRRGWKVDNLLAVIAADERIKGKLLILGPGDAELEALYFNCLFTLLPSFYEGWSLTLPESLSYGKFCLVSDVDPLRETGSDLVEYIHPLDTIAWAERIAYYANHLEELKAREAQILKGWHPRTWLDSTKMLVDKLHSAHAKRFVY
jgi:glycosyltransferase involved in cell wall biosynthesis